MDQNDFVFEKSDENEHYCDYWFKIIGKTREYLTNKYMEQSMICVSEAVFSIADGQWGIKRIFPFNYDVITPDDNELYEILKSAALSQDIKSYEKEELR